jgi:4'-phosphopantetheinyl transferase
LVQLYWLARALADVPRGDDWLSAHEREHLARLKVPKRRDDWRLGRWTAKQALRSAWGRVGMPSDPGALQILAAPDGAPQLVGIPPPLPSFSLSHSHAAAFCVVGPAGVRVGCDLETVEPRSAAFAHDFFTEHERTLFDRCQAVLRPLVTTLIWSAKESALKARRTGLRADTRSVGVHWSGGLTGGGWQALEVTVAGVRSPLRGWWQTHGQFVLTIVAQPAAQMPTQLQTGPLGA